MRSVPGGDPTPVPGGCLREPGGPGTYALLFDADGNDHAVDPDDVPLDTLTQRQLLWIDHQGHGVRELLQRLGLGAAVPALDDDWERPSLRNFGDWFLVHVVAIAPGEHLACAAQSLLVISGQNFVVTLHREPLEFLAQLRDRERAETRIGVLGAESFTASLLDWQMGTYFDAVAELEADVDQLEVRLLADPRPRDYVSDLAALRRAASRLRRMLAPHRRVYGAMARPDFRPDAGPEVQAQFRALIDRFERSLDTVETARELVIGSFELFATHAAQRTNDIMRALTFVTVLLGTLAVVAGVLGMNFEAPLFRTGARGFTVTIVLMAALVLAALGLARWRRWW